jgi:restriction system protein
MNLLDAAESILTEAGQPLKPADLIKRILDRRLWTTQGRTPEATLSAQLAVDLKEHRAASRFQRTARGVFALRAWALPEYAPAKESKRPPSTAKKPRPRLVKTLSFTDAAEQVLLRLGNKKPMHYRDITEKAFALKLVRSAGQTPEATLYAQILTEISRKTRRGEAPRFVKHGKGFVGLTQWMGTGLAFQIEQHNITIRKKLHAQHAALPPADFEARIGQLLTAIGFEEVTITNRTGDGGIDVRGTLVVGDVIRTRMAVQVKRWKHNVQAPTVQQVRGSLGTHEQGLIITTSDFSPGARTEAERSTAVPVASMNGQQLVALLAEHNLGVHRNSYDLLELGPQEEE